MSAFNPLVPTGLVNLDSDYKNIQNNFQQLDTSFGVDHLPFSNGTNQNGYHKQVHLTNEANPGIGNASGVLYANLLSGQSYPFWTNALGTFPLLGPVTAALSGSITLAGGIKIKWGTVNLTAGKNTSPTVSFASSGGNFTTQVYVAFTQFIAKAGGTSSSNNSLSIISASLTTSGFTCSSNLDSSGDMVAFYWVAIGI